MDQQIAKRQHRMALARYKKDTTGMCDLVAAAVEQAAIHVHNLQGKEATKMRGRSRISLRKQVKDMLQGSEDDPEETILASRAKLAKRSSSGPCGPGQQAHQCCEENESRNHEEYMRSNKQDQSGI